MCLKCCYAISLPAEIHGGHQESITSVTCRISSCTGSHLSPFSPQPTALLQPFQMLRVLASSVGVKAVVCDAYKTGKT
jgi:hypothetical protein